MKFILIYTVCSFINGSCLPDTQYPKIFDTWRECVTAAHQESQIILNSLPPQMVEANRLATKYTCQQLLGA